MLLSLDCFFAPRSVLSRMNVSPANPVRALAQEKVSLGRNVCSRLILPMVVGVLLGMLGCGASSHPTSSPPPSQVIKTVFVIVMENHNWTGDRTLSIKGNGFAPYINNTLAPMSSYASMYFNPPHIHPSLPNYLWLEAGINFGILDDNSPYVHHQNTHEHLATLLDAKGISWKDYDEGSSGTYCPLDRWHDPFVFFDDVTDSNNRLSSKCIAHMRPLKELAPDLLADNVARYNFIVPSNCHDMHTSCNGKNQIQAGDDWLASNVPSILASSAYRQNGLIMVLWDEARVGDGPVPLFMLSPLAKGNGYTNNIPYTHSSTLRTIEEIFGVTPMLGDAANATDLRDLFVGIPWSGQ